jgi:hypothetical protein
MFDVVVAKFKFVAALLAVTFAPTTAAPVVSVTLPTIDP